MKIQKETQKKCPFNFESVFGIIERNIDSCTLIKISGYRGNDQAAIFMMLFNDYYIAKNKEDKMISPGTVNEYIHGKRPLTSFIKHYTLIENRKMFEENFLSYFIEAMGQNIYIANSEILQLYKGDKPLFETNENPVFIASPKMVISSAMDTPIGKKEQQDIAHFFAEAIYYAMKEPIIKDNNENSSVDVFPPPCNPFLGREEELKELLEVFKGKESVKFFLTGYSGLGKSELAKKFALQYKTKNKPIFYLLYEDDFKTTIAKMSLSKESEGLSEDEKFKVNAAFLRSLSSDCLLVIDNFNVGPTEDEYFDTVMKYRCKVLFTSTYSYEPEISLNLKEIEDSELLFRLIEVHYQNKKKCEQYKEVIFEIIDALNRHTFILVLAAKLMKAKHIEPPKLLELLKEGLWAYNTKEEFNVTKDGKNQKQTFGEHIALLFSLFHLDEEELKIMKNMCMVPVSGIYCNLFAEWTGNAENMTGINDLITMGLINENEDGEVSLHSLTKEYFLHKNKPQLDDFTQLLDNLYTICSEKNYVVSNHTLVFSTIENILMVAQKTSEFNWDFFMDFLIEVYRSMDNCKYRKGTSLVIEVMADIVNGAHKDNFYSKAVYCLYFANHCDDIEQKILLYDLALNEYIIYLKPTPENVLLESNILFNMAEAYLAKGELQLAKGLLNEAIALRNKTEFAFDYIGAKQKQSYFIVSSFLGETKKCLEVLDSEAKTTKVLNSLYYATIQETIGLIHLYEGAEDSGISHLNEALIILSEIYENDRNYINAKITEICTNYKKYRDVAPVPVPKYDLTTLERINDLEN